MKQSLLLVAGCSVMLAGPLDASLNNSPVVGEEPKMTFADRMILAETKGQEIRDDRRDDRDDRSDDRQDCRQTEGVGDDKRDCKQDARQDRNSDG